MGKARRLVKFQVGIVLHDACIRSIQDLSDIWKEVANRCFFVWCGCGLDLRYTGFSTLGHAQPHRRKQLFNG